MSINGYKCIYIFHINQFIKFGELDFISSLRVLNNLIQCCPWSSINSKRKGPTEVLPVPK